MTRFQTETSQIRHQLGDRHHLGVVAALGGGDDEPVGLPLGQPVLVDLGRRKQLGASDPGGGRRPGIGLPHPVGEVPPVAGRGQNGLLPRASASRCSRMTFSGR